MKKGFMLMGLLLGTALMFSVSGCSLLDELADEVSQTHEDETIETKTVWEGKHIIKGSLDVKDELIIKACTKIYMDDGAAIRVSDDGALKIQGSKDCMVKITSAKSVPAQGDWYQIAIYDDASNDNEIKYAVIEYGSDDMLYVGDGASIREVSHTTFRGAKGEAVYIAAGANVGKFEDCTFEGNNGHPISTYNTQLGVFKRLSASENKSDAIYADYNTITTDTTIGDVGIPIEIESLRMEEAVVTIEAGTVLLMRSGADINVYENGAIKMLGTEDNHITITSYKRAPAPGDWRNINIYSEAAADSILRYTDISYGGGSGGQLYVADGARIELDHVTFSNAKECDIDARGTITITATTYKACE